MEKIIQISTNEQTIFALTSTGRIFSKKIYITDNWQEEEGIELYIKKEDNIPTTKLQDSKLTTDIIESDKIEKI